MLLLCACTAWAVPLQSDLNSDGIVDFLDFSIMAGEWLQTPDNNEPNDSNGILQDYLDTGDSTYQMVGEETSGGILWQGFTANQDYTLRSISLFLLRYDNPGTVTVSIRLTDAGGFPLGNDLCSGTTNGSTLWIDTPEWRSITLNPSIQLASGEQYVILLQSGDYVEWRMTSYDAYAGGISGNFYFSTWNPWLPLMDFLFETYGD
jgi:hypothetical protein